MKDRQRYWKLDSAELESLTYNESKLLNWEIKCTKKNNDESFVGAFAYRGGIPLGYETIKGVAFYHNRINDTEKNSVSDIIKKEYGGNAEDHSNRVIIRDSTVPYSGAAVGALSRKLEELIDGKSIITLEFEDLTQAEQDSAGLPATKLLPIPGSHTGE